MVCKLTPKIIITIISLCLAGLFVMPINAYARTIESYAARPILSVVGDSISSYYGYADWPYYGPEGTEVSCVMDESDMWWYRFAEDNNFDLGMPAAMSGARLTLPEDDRFSFFYPPRLDAIDKNGVPDYIVIYGGTNDIFNKAKLKDFHQCYQSLTDRLYSMFDNVKLIMVGLGYFIRTDMVSALYVDLYDIVIRTASKENDAYYADLRGELYEEDFSDVEGFGVHPNESGMAKISDALTEAFNEERGVVGIDSIRADLDYDHYTIKINAYNSDYDSLRFRFKLTDDTTGEIIYNTDWGEDNCFLLDDVDSKDTYTAYAEIDNNADGIAEANMTRVLTELSPKRTGETVYNGIDYSPVYDFNYYVENYSDLYDVFRNNPQGALEHFVTFGMSEGRQATETFNVWTYGSNNPDLSEAFWLNLPLYYNHYITYGQYEGR